ncbi:DUF6173 family protein [Paracoccaceae bacterium GXU_MW_L88]
MIDSTADALENSILAKAAKATDDAPHMAEEDARKDPKVDPTGKSPAEWAYERVILYIKNFEKQLDSEQEVAMGFAGSDAGTMRIQGLAFFAPDILAFYGMDQRGNKAQLVQHVSQLNLMLRAVPKLNETAERIGFRLSGEAETAKA